MDILIDYLKKHAFWKGSLAENPSEDLSMVVVIPSYNEENLLSTVKSLANCNQPLGDVEVLIVFNAAEDDSEEIKQSNVKACLALNEWQKNYGMEWLSFYGIIQNELPKKHAGVGLARKIGMDVAAERLFAVERSEAPIVCFDADSQCEKNYLIEIEKHFKSNKSTTACSIYFEHPLQGSEFSEEVYFAIALYELHLRYYRKGLVFAKAAFAYHTIGSSMAVRAVDYCKQGGMNKRKAGEDFYFLQKFIELGIFSEINTTKVIPSPRASDRVPFGTGRAVGQHISQQKDIGLSYNPKSYLILKEFLEGIPLFYKGEYKKIPSEVKKFIGDESILIDEIKKIKQQSNTYSAFQKRFFRWFNAFKTLKFIHFLRDEGLEEISIQQAATELEKLMDLKGGKSDVKEILIRYREYDRNLILHRFSL